MTTKKQNIHDKELSTDEEIRNLVLARLSVLSADTIKSIGNDGVFSRDQLIEHVKKGDKIGQIIEEIEMEWLRAMKTGKISELFV